MPDTRAYSDERAPLLSENVAKFQAMKAEMEAYCQTQIDFLNSTLKGAMTRLQITLNEQEKAELEACIEAYRIAQAKLRSKQFSESNVAKAMMVLGGASCVVGLIAFGAPVAVVVGLCAGGGAVAGLGKVGDMLFNGCKKDAMAYPIAQAEKKTERFLENLVTTHSNPRNKNDLTANVEKFKTESANFKKRMALYALGTLHLVLAAVIIAASHGAALPVALKVAAMGVKSISAGMMVGAAVSKTVIGVGLIAAGKSFVSTRSTGLEKALDDAEADRTQSPQRR